MSRSNTWPHYLPLSADLAELRLWNNPVDFVPVVRTSVNHARTPLAAPFISPHLCGRQSISPVQASALSRRIAEKPEALGKEKK